MDFYVVMLQEHAVNWIRRLVYGFLHAEEQPGGDEVAFELLAFVRGGDHVEQVPRQRQRRFYGHADAAAPGRGRDGGHREFVIMGERTDKARRPLRRARRGGAGQLNRRWTAKLRQERFGDDPCRSARAMHRSDGAGHGAKLCRRQGELVPNRYLAARRAELRMRRAREDIQPFRQLRQNCAATLVVSHVAKSGIKWLGLKGIGAFVSPASPAPAPAPSL